jgi:adenine-specific DNA-methyltransferase
MTKLVHQIWHGDSREMCQRFKPGRINCIVTDPPFGVDNLSNMAVTKEGKEYARKIAGDSSPEEALQLFQEVMEQLLPRTAPNCDLYIVTAHQVLERWLAMAKSDDMARHGFKYKAVLVWEKDGPGMGDLNSWGQGHEFILYLKKGNRVNSDKRRSGVIHVPQLRPKDLIHPHEKPTALLEMFLKQSTDPGDFVVDPFGGSGSLVRAARAIGRSAVAIEYDEKNWRLATDKLEGGEQMDLFGEGAA